MAFPSNQLEYQKSHNGYGYWAGFKKKQDIKIPEIQVIQQSHLLHNQQRTWKRSQISITQNQNLSEAKECQYRNIFEWPTHITNN